MSSETESVTHCYFHISLNSFIKCKIKTRVYLFIISKMIDSRRHHTMNDGS